MFVVFSSSLCRLITLMKEKAEFEVVSERYINFCYLYSVVEFIFQTCLVIPLSDVCNRCSLAFEYCM